MLGRSSRFSGPDVGGDGDAVARSCASSRPLGSVAAVGASESLPDSVAAGVDPDILDPHVHSCASVLSPSALAATRVFREQDRVRLISDHMKLGVILRLCPHPDSTHMFEVRWDVGGEQALAPHELEHVTV